MSVRLIISKIWKMNNVKQMALNYWPIIQAYD